MTKYVYKVQKILKEARKAVKQRDPSRQLRHALSHKVETNPKAYTRKLKHPEEDDTELSDE